MRGADLTFAFPALLTAVMITALRGPGAYTVMIAIGIFTAPVLARVTPAAAGVIWVQDFARAARALGRGKFAVTRVHILPNILGVLIVQITLQLSLAILAEAGLSFVGLGAQPPAPSWGRMLNDAQTYIYTAPFLTLFPGLAIALAVLGLNMLGDGLRDAFDLQKTETRMTAPWTVRTLSAALARGEMTAEAVAEQSLARIAAEDGILNAVITPNPRVLEDARAIDRRRAAGEAVGPLAGIPVLVKDTMDMAGLPTTGGWAKLSARAGGIDLIPRRDSAVVARMRAAGALAARQDQCADDERLRHQCQ